MLGIFQRLRARLGNRAAQAPAACPGHRPSCPISIAYDAQGIVLSLDGRAQQSVAWGEIDLIAIRIEDEWLPLPYWYVGNQDNLLRIPNDAIGAHELFFAGFSEHISGYSSDATFDVVIAASAATEGSFVVWQAANAPAA